MPEVLSVGGLLIPTLRLSLLLSLFLAPWLVGRFASRLSLDSLEAAWTARMAENSVWLGLGGARLGFVIANWSAYWREPWSILYVWQGGFMPVAGVLAGSAFVLWRLQRRQLLRQRRYLWALLQGFGTAALLFGLVFAATRVELDVNLLRSGDRMPDFVLKDLRGNPARFASLKGQVVVLNFWATWCPPCRREMPLLDEIQQTYGPEGLTIVGVDLDEPPEVVAAYVGSVGVQYPIWLDDPARAVPDRTRDLYTKLGGVGLPTTVFIGRDGVIHGSQVGELSRGVLQSRVEALLALPRGQ